MRERPARSQRLLLVIGSFDGTTGLGGHYYSMLSIFVALNKEMDVRVLNIGDYPAQALANSDLPFEFIPIEVGIFRVRRDSVERELLEFSPDVVVAFDVQSGQVVRPLCARHRVGFVQVKAGGEIPLGYFPRNVNQIHFGYEDIAWAKKRTPASRFVEWIPNRVPEAVADPESGEQLRNRIGQFHGLTAMRVGRISRQYAGAFDGAITLIEAVRAEGFDARLVIIGASNDRGYLDALKARISAPDVVLTEPPFVHDSRRYLSLADINIGVGRGFMEGCAAGNHMFFPDASGGLPICVCDHSMQYLFKRNFSMRSALTEPIEKRKQDLIHTVKKVSAGEKVSHLAIGWFDEMFSVKCVPERYGALCAVAARCYEKRNLDLLVSEVYLRFRYVRRSIVSLVPSQLARVLRAKLRSWQKDI